MRSDRRIVYQQKQIDKLTERIHELEQQNKTLEQENDSLAKINDANSRLIADLEIKQKAALEQYKIGLAEVEEIKGKCKEAIKAARSIQREYENKTNILISRLRKQVN